MRNVGLDVLRGIAVILVLFRHSNLENNMLRHFGWLGVDLFFVLSGFLISNILFNEYKQYGQINLKRFLVRRVVRIFPPFYFFLFFTLLFGLFVRQNITVEIKPLLAELFYLQSYLPRIWLHTWSLAVEEHFYLVFPLLLFLIIRANLIEKRRLIGWVLIGLLLLCFALRLNVSYPHRNDGHFGFMQTHLKLDGILCGVLLSYFLNFSKKLNINQWVLMGLSILLIAPGFYFKGGSFFMNTVGITSVSIGFAILVWLAWTNEKRFQPRKRNVLYVFIKSFSFIGLTSYSIYLWHINAKNITAWILPRESAYFSYAYMAVAIIAGIFMFYLVEKPVMRYKRIVFEKTPK